MINKPNPQEPKKVVYRDSESGQFVPQRYAERNPRTTERERVSTGK